MLDNDHHVHMLSMYAREGNLREMEKTVQVFGLGAGVFNHKKYGMVEGTRCRHPSQS